jgi:superoxide dismutase
MRKKYKYVWVSVGVKFAFWAMLKNRADRNKTSIQRELEEILNKEFGAIKVMKQMGAAKP